jgi:PEP-CTERM motif
LSEESLLSVSIICAAAESAAFFQGDVMMHIHLGRVFAGLSLSMGLMGAMPTALATPITLNTTWLDANGRLTLTTDARQTLALTGIDMSVGGKAITLSEGVFNLPISQITADVQLLPPSLSMKLAQAKGSSLDFVNTLNQSTASLSDLSMDFNSHLVYGDVLSAAGTSRLSLFTFDVTEPLAFSFKGGISVNMTLGNLHFTDVGATSFAQALGLPDFLAPVLKQVDFGVIDARVVPWFRKTIQASSVPMVRMQMASSVPEPSSGVLYSLGLVMAAVVWRRKGCADKSQEVLRMASPGVH